MLLQAVAGRDLRDSTSIDAPVPDYLASIGDGVRGLRIGIPKEYFVPGMDGDVERAVRSAIDRLVALGAVPVEVSLPHTDYAVATYYIVATAEASSNLGRYDGVRFGLRKGGDNGLRDMYGETRDGGNAKRVYGALVEFGFGGVRGLSVEDFERPERVVLLGTPPVESTR